MPLVFPANKKPLRLPQGFFRRELAAATAAATVTINTRKHFILL